MDGFSVPHLFVGAVIARLVVDGARSEVLKAGSDASLRVSRRETA